MKNTLSLIFTLVATLTAHANETLSLKQQRDGEPAVSLSGSELRQLGDPFFHLVLEEHADAVSLSEIQNLLQPDPAKRNLFVVHERIVDSTRPSTRRSVISFQGTHDGHVLNTNVMLSVFFSSEGFPESPTSTADERLSSLEAWGWDNHRGRYNYYKLDRSGTPGLEMTWKFRGSSVGADQLTSFDRRNTCMACHVNGGPLMKELFLPWSNWHSFKSPSLPLLMSSPPNQRWPVASSDPLQRLTSAERLEISILAALRQFNTRRINATLKREDATGNIEVTAAGRQTEMEGKRLLRHLFETTEFNIISAPVLSASHPFGTPGNNTGEVEIPASFFLNANLIGEGGPGGYQGLGLPNARSFSAQARALLQASEYKASVSRLNLKILGQFGDSQFAWFVPEASHIDNDMVDQLINRGIVPGQFVAAALAIDLKRPILSESRASLLKYVPDEFSFQPIAPDERTDFAVFKDHELTKAVISAIEADNPSPGSPAQQFLDLIDVADPADAPLTTLQDRIAVYISEVDAALNQVNAEQRKQAIDVLLIKADTIRKNVIQHPVLGNLDETGGFGLFPSR